jgi:hypothetical protein
MLLFSSCQLNSSPESVSAMRQQAGMTQRSTAQRGEPLGTYAALSIHSSAIRSLPPLSFVHLRRRPVVKQPSIADHPQPSTGMASGRVT